MSALFINEISKIYRQKWLWLIVLGILVISYTDVSFFMQGRSVLHPDFFSESLMTYGISSNLYLWCNIFVAVLAASVYTDEFQNGQLRFVFLRRFSKAKIFVSKLLTIYFLLFLLLVFYGIVLCAAGSVQIPIEGYANKQQLIVGSALQTLSVYFMAYITLIAICSLFVCLAMYSKNVTYALGFCMIYILFSLLLDGVNTSLAGLFPPSSYFFELFRNITIPYMQYSNLNILFAGSSNSIAAMITLVLLHVAVFTYLSFKKFTRADYFS